jgi:hypothetical protein
MPTNFTFTLPVEKGSIGSAQPCLNGEPIADPADQAPTGSWAEVTLPTLPPGVSGVLCHIVSDVALRFQVKGATPGASPGSLILANGERTIGVPAGKKLWIK